jgi:hypothetical protein
MLNMMRNLFACARFILRKVTSRTPLASRRAPLTSRRACKIAIIASPLAIAYAPASRRAFGRNLRKFGVKR